MSSSLCVIEYEIAFTMGMGTLMSNLCIPIKPACKLHLGLHLKPDYSMRLNMEYHAYDTQTSLNDVSSGTGRPSKLLLDRKCRCRLQDGTPRNVRPSDEM